MPLFMLISGYLFFFSFEKRELSDLIVHRIQGLLQPIVLCGIAYYYLSQGLSAAIKGNADALLSGQWLGSLGGYWFLWSVLSATLVVTIAYKITDSAWLHVAFLVIGIFFVALFPNAVLNLFMYPYFVLGFLYAKNRRTICHFSNLKYVCLPLFPIMMLYYNKDHYIYTTGLTGEEGLLRHMPINMYRWAIGLIGSIFVIATLEWIYRKILIKSNLSLIVKYIERLGQKSLQIYILQGLFLSTYYAAVYSRIVIFFERNIVSENMLVYNCVYTPALALLCSVALLWMIELLEKYNISKILFGK